MESRDLVGLARAKEAELDGGRAGPNVEDVDTSAVLARGEDVTNSGISEGEGPEEQGEGLMEEQEFSIKEASFQEGSLKLKIQTTKRAKKPPKSLENYICPPEIRMTIRPPSGDARGGRPYQRGAGPALGRGLKEEERAPPRKRTYERQVGDQTPSKQHLRGAFLSAHSQQPQLSQHTHSDWSSLPVPPIGGAVHSEVDRDSAAVCRRSLSDPSHSVTVPCRSPSPELQLPVVTDASVLNLTSLSRGRGLQEVNEQLFGNIKRKYGRKDSHRMLPNPPSAAETPPWSRQPEKGSVSPSKSAEHHRPRPEEQVEQLQEESAERRKEDKERLINGRKGDEENRRIPVLAEEGKGRKRRRQPSLEMASAAGEQTDQQLDADVPASGLPELKSMRAEVGGQRAEMHDKAENGAETVALEPDGSTNCSKKNPTNRLKLSPDTLKPRDPPYNHISKPCLNTISRLPSPRASISNISPTPSPKISPRPRMDLSPTPSHSTSSSTSSSRLSKVTDRWSYQKAKSHASLTSPQRDSLGSPSTLAEPPSAFPITPSSPLYTNTDSLTVHAPIKRKRGRPKKQPLLTVETIHEGTSTLPPSPQAQEATRGPSFRQKTHMVTMSSPLNHGSSKARRSRGIPRPMTKTKLGKMQSILNEILSTSSQNGSLSSKSPSGPVSSAMSAMASTIEARLGKQINVSKRGTIYIGKKRGRKPRLESQSSSLSKINKDKPLVSLYESAAVPSTGSSPTSTALSVRSSMSDAAMPNLQPISALPAKPLGRSFLTGGWKLSPPRLLANSPSHLSEGASAKEVTLSPISESHSEETIPSDSGIGTDNNSTSDQTEKGHASRRRYSFDLCGYETPEAATVDVSNRSNRARCNRQATTVDNFLSQQEKKQKHHRRKRKCLQSRDHLHFLSELEEVVLKLQQLRVSHRRFTCYPQPPYPSIFRLNFHHYYPITYESFSCDTGSYLRRNADLKAKRRRGRPAKASDPVPSKLPYVPGYGYPLAGGNYYAGPYAMPYAAPLSLGYFPPAPPFYLSHPSLGPATPSPFMRPAVPPPKAFHPGGLSKLQPGAKLGPLQGASVRGEGLAHLGSGSASGLAGVRLHKRKHKHKHKHKDEPLLSPRDRQELGGLFSGAKSNARLSILSERRDPSSRGSSNHPDKTRGISSDSNLGSNLGIFDTDKLSSQFHSRQTGQPMTSFLKSHQSQRAEAASDLFFGSRGDEYGRNRTTRLGVFGDQGMMSFQAEETNRSSSPSLKGVPNKQRYKRREVEQIQKDVRRMHSLNFEHVQKILRAKRLQRQAKTGNNVVKRRPGRPRKEAPEESGAPSGRGGGWADERGVDIQAGVRGSGRTLGMPILERCDGLPGRPDTSPGLPEFSHHDTISATIETVVDRARGVPSLAKAGKRRGRGGLSRDASWSPTEQ